MDCDYKNTEQISKKHCCCLGIGDYIYKYSKRNLGIAQCGCNINRIIGIHLNKDKKGKNYYLLKDPYDSHCLDLVISWIHMETRETNYDENKGIIT